MQINRSFYILRLAAGTALCAFSLASARGQADAYRGLWVGQAALSFVNEVTVPLDADNVPRAPDPSVPTPTSDQAHLRLILHVNGAGQVHLLKDVALLNRNPNDFGANGNPVNLLTNLAVLAASNQLLNAESDLALVTDERLYGEFPPQPAVRFASAVFDFGDSRATELAQAAMAAAAEAAAASVAQTSEDLNTLSGRTAAENAARQAAANAAAPVVDNADVAAAFDAFLRGTDLNSAVLDTIAGAGSPALAAQPALTAASNLQARSVYDDARAVDMVRAVVAAVEAAAPSAKTNEAHNTAASFADVANDYHRFLSGKLFGDMITAAARAAAEDGTNSTATPASIQAAVSAAPVVNDARTEALRLKIPFYRDTRATMAVQQVLDAIVASAAAFLSDPGRTLALIQSAAETAGRETANNSVRRYAVSAQNPTADYNAFVRSQTFQNSDTLAAEAAAKGAVSERRNNPLYTADSLRDAALTAAVTALRGVLSEAARAVQTELPLAGGFGPGQGDARLTWDIKRNSAPPLGQPALTGTIFLPANHPTNPFRHRRHPDHAVGFDINRRIRLDFDGSPTNALARAGYGVDRITGVFREEVFGLHKPLGPQPKTEPIGLKVEGTFELNRISLIDTLNAR